MLTLLIVVNFIWIDLSEMTELIRKSAGGGFIKAQSNRFRIE